MYKKQRKHPFKGAFSYVRIALLDKSGKTTATSSNTAYETVGNIQGIRTYGNNNSYVSISGMEQWNSDFTINVLLCATSIGEVGFICRGETMNNDGTFHFMFRNSSTISFAFYADDLDCSMSFQTNKWYNIIGTYNRSSKSMKVYINGTLIGSKTSSGYPNFGTSNVFLGKRNYSTASAIPFNGIQAQFIAENKEWNQQEITDYWNYISEKYGLS